MGQSRDHDFIQQCPVSVCLAAACTKGSETVDATTGTAGGSESDSALPKPSFRRAAYNRGQVARPGWRSVRSRGAHLATGRADGQNGSGAYYDVPPHF